MAQYFIPQRVESRRGTYLELYARNEVLLDGEICFETHDADGLEHSPWKWKVGDDTTHWNDLEYEATGSGTTTDIAAEIHAATDKATPVDADELGLVDSAASNVLKKLTWANLKATLKTYFDTLYNTYTNEQAQDTVAAMIAAGTHSGISFTYDDTNNKISAAVTALTGSIGCSFDGNGAVLQTNVSADILVPYNCTITGWTLLADQSGSLVIGVWSDAFANYPPTVADKITSTNPPTLSSADHVQGSLSGWTTTLTAGTTLRFNIDSVATITRATLILQVTRT